MARRDADDVIEKRDPNPVTISALVIAVVALLGAMVLQIMEIAEYGKRQAQAIVADDTAEFDSSVNKILVLNDGSDEDLGDDEDDDEDESEEDEEEELDEDDDLGI
jgi:phosphopantothenoylcysteine synthetase/decarboxylase